MIRGTTPTIKFVLPFRTELLVEAWVTISQNDTVIIDKPLEECECNNNTLTVTLTQEETLKLSCDCMAQIQVRVKTTGNHAPASRIIDVKVEKILKEGVI